MVKVKDIINVEVWHSAISFNHPMVKVKELHGDIYSKPEIGFNHPMVKVKGIKIAKENSRSRVSTTLW